MEVKCNERRDRISGAYKIINYCTDKSLECHNVLLTVNGEFKKEKPSI
jgi:hypothetical protein